MSEYIDNSNILYPYSNNTFVNQNRQVFENSQSGWLWHTYMASGGEKYYTVSALHTNKSDGITGEKYFNGLYNYYKNYSNYSFALSSNSSYISSNGRVTGLPTYSKCVTYNVTYVTGSTSKTITLSTILPGTVA